jgi:5-methylcytosine-specific restriction endonuclease McrA
MGRPVTGMRAFTSVERREIRRQLIEKYGLFCQICLAKGNSAIEATIDMSDQYSDKYFSIDHIIALADGGRNTIDNFHPTHIACNELKGSNKVAGRVRQNRRPHANRDVSQVTGSRLAYSSES